MTKCIKSGVSKQIIKYSYSNMKNKFLRNKQPTAAVICLFLALILSAGILAGCGGGGNSGNGNDTEPLNGIDTTESLNWDSITWDGGEWG